MPGRLLQKDEAKASLRRAQFSEDEHFLAQASGPREDSGRRLTLTSIRPCSIRPLAQLAVQLSVVELILRIRRARLAAAMEPSSLVSQHLVRTY